MSHRDVYDCEMIRQKFSDSDIERVLSGQEPESETLARLAPALVALYAERPEAPSEETISRLAAEAAEVARSSAPDQDNAASPEPGSRYRGSLRRRLATLTAALFVFAGMTGIAFAADSAAPGDTLYGLDRALEQVGINDGGVAERVAEAQTLTSNGRVPDAIHHLADTFEEEQEEETTEVAKTADALREAADHVQSDNDDPESQEVRNSVAAMLDEMASMFGESQGDRVDFGQRIAEMARQIHAGVGDGEGAPEDTGPPEDPGQAGDTGEQSGNGDGPPDEIGPAEDAEPAGTPGTPGKP